MRVNRQISNFLSRGLSPVTCGSSAIDSADNNHFDYSSSSSSGVAAGFSPGGFCFPCRGTPDESGWEGDFRGAVCGASRGANFAEGDDRLEGVDRVEGDGRVEGDSDSSGSTLWRGEINDLGGDVGFGETDGLGEAVTAGAAVAWGVGLGEEAIDAPGVGLVPPDDQLLFEVQVNEPLAGSFSIAATVRTSPPLKLPTDFSAGSLAVGA